MNKKEKNVLLLGLGYIPFMIATLVVPKHIISDIRFISVAFIVSFVYIMFTHSYTVKNLPKRLSEIDEKLVLKCMFVTLPIDLFVKYVLGRGFSIAGYTFFCAITIITLIENRKLKDNIKG